MSAAAPGRRRTLQPSGSLLGGAGLLVAGRYAVSALGFVSNVVIVQKLTQSEFGQYTFIFSLLSIVGFISELKLSRAVLASVFEAGEGEASDRVMGSYVALRLIIGVVSYAVFLAIVFVRGGSTSFVVSCVIVGVNLVLLGVANGMMLLFEARLWMRALTVALVLPQVVQVLLTLAIAFSYGGTLIGFMVAAVANAVVTLLWLAWALHGVARIRLRFERSQWWVWLKEAIPLSLGSALGTVYFRIDIVMLSIIGSYSATAIYGVGYKLSDLIGAAIPVAVLTPVLTIMVRAWPDEHETFQRTFRHALVLLTVAGVGTGVGLCLAATPIVTFVYGARYAASGDATRWLVAGQVLHFFTALCFTTLISAMRHRLYPCVMLGGVVLNVALNLVLIPAYSYIGSGVATVITEILVLAVLGIAVARVPGTRPFPFAPVAKTLVAGAAFAAAYLALVGPTNWLAAGFVGGLVFLATLHLLRVDGPGGLLALRDTIRLDRASAAAGPRDIAAAEGAAAAMEVTE